MSKKQKANKKQNKKQNKSSNASENQTETIQQPSEQETKLREAVVKITRDIAATDEGFRTEATKRLPTFLKESNFYKMDLDTCFIDFRKLWKGTLYGFWLCDGEFKQHEMAELMAGLIHAVKGSSENPHELPIAFLRAFFDELFETWPKLDRHRMDKYLMLVRKVMQQAFIFLNKTHHYRSEVVDEFIEFILTDGIYNNEDRNIMASLQIHVAELFFLELIQFGGPHVELDSDYHLTEDVLMKFLAFFIKDFATTKNIGIIKTYKEEVFDLFLQYEIPSEGDNTEMQDDQDEQTEEDNEEGEMDEDEEEDSDLPLDEFGNRRQITKDRPLPINIQRIVKEFEKYVKGFPQSEQCKEYFEKFKTRIITIDDLYSELDEIESTPKTSEKKEVTSKKGSASETKPEVRSDKKKKTETTKSEKKTEAKTETKKQSKSETKEVTQKKDKSEKKTESKQKVENKETPKVQKSEMTETVKPAKKSTKKSQEKEPALEEPKNNTQVKDMKQKLLALKKKKAEVVLKKSVKIDLNKNQVKTFDKKDIVQSIPVDLTFSPTKGLLKRKQVSVDAPVLDLSERSTKKKK